MCRRYRFPSPTSAPSGHLLPKEGGSIHASPFPWKGLPSAARRGWLPFLRRSRLLFTFPIGEGGPRSGARVLSYIVDLRRSSPPLFHAASALSAPSGHLPLEGKAVCRGYRFPLPTSAPSGHLLPKEGGSIHASPFPWKGLLSAARRGWFPFLRRSRLLFPFPIGEGGPRSGARVLSYIAYLRRSSSLSFIPLVPYPPLRGTFPTRGRLCVENTLF